MNHLVDRMSTANNKQYLLRLLNSQKMGVSMATLIDYLDYINKVRYSVDEVKMMLDELVASNDIVERNGIWFSSGKQDPIE